ncbi:MAG TPA: zinc-binding dehydrogenase [Polyangia bacterium]|nr:zinc-binding dehydrogenase [Polyangia bacterium]
MIGALPEHVERFTLDGERVTRARVPPRLPGPAEVVVRVDGCALGVEPRAEIAGEVIAAGDAAAEWLGRRVVVPRALPCGDCELCRRGRAAVCAARAPRDGLATHETVPARFLCSVEPPLWPDGEELWRMAALADAAAAPYAALVRAGLAPGDPAVVIGGGARGAFTIAIARAKGAHPVIVDGDARLRERALGLGAAFALDAALAPDEARADFERQARERGLRVEGTKILETTGTAAGRYRAIAMLPDGATAVLLDGSRGEPAPAPAIDWENFAASERTVLGAAAAHPDLYPELCALLVRGELALAPLVRAVSVDEAGAALAARRAGTLVELPIIRPNMR